jgi:hypothetical protein
MKISDAVSFDNFAKLNDSKIKTSMSGKETNGVRSADPSFKIKEFNTKQSKANLNETKSKSNLAKAKPEK